MVYERRQPRRSADDRLVDRFTRRESAAARARRIARKRIDIPKEVIDEFNQQLDQDTAREARAIAQELTHTPTQETRTMATTKRTPTTKRAEPTPVTPKPEPKAATKTKTAKKAKKAKATKPSDRTTVLAKYKASKLAVQKQVKIGAVITYHGRNAALDGKAVKVTGYESLGGVFVTYKDTRHVVSPNSLKPKQVA